MAVRLREVLALAILVSDGINFTALAAEAEATVMQALIRAATTAAQEEAVLLYPPRLHFVTVEQAETV